MRWGRRPSGGGGGGGLARIVSVAPDKRNGNSLKSKDDNDNDEYDFALGDNIYVGTYRVWCREARQLGYQSHQSHIV